MILLLESIGLKFSLKKRILLGMLLGASVIGAASVVSGFIGHKILDIYEDDLASSYLLELKVLKFRSSLYHFEKEKDKEFFDLSNKHLTFINNQFSKDERLSKIVDEVKNVKFSKKNVEEKFEEKIENILSSIENEKKLMQKQVSTLKKNVVKIILISLIVSIILLSVVYFLIGKVIDSIMKVSKNLKENVYHSEKTSGDVNTAAVEVSSATSEQASAIQETVATLSQITAMVNKSVENAKHSSLKARESHDVALGGKNSIEEMLTAIHEISDSNDDVLEHLSKSNKEISEIVEVINEISEKTTVINDIVFQTKLLSFNASVEAARAGEHGKGFAVVAEEVGNLAQMSGNASSEIEVLLHSSIEKVQNIVKDTQSKVEKLIDTSKGKVEAGIVVAKECEQVFDSVVSNVNDVSKMMSEISTAAEEQAEGVENITLAMHELDKTTHANAGVAGKTSEYSKSMLSQAQEISYLISVLDSEVYGTKVSRKTDQIKTKQTEKEMGTSKGKHLEKENVIPLKKAEVKTKIDEEVKTDFPKEDDSRFVEL